MKRPLNSKEVVLILLPLLGLGAFALYQRRLEQVGRADGIVVSSVEIKSAKGRFQAEGLSHEVKVTLGHSGARPDWWSSWNNLTSLDPQKDIGEQTRSWRFSPQRTVAYGAVLTTTSIKNGRPIVKQQWLDNRINAARRDNKIVFSHEIPLDKIPMSAGEVTFRGVYLVAGREPVRVTRVVRKAGEVSSQPPDRNPNGRLISVKAEAFNKMTVDPAKPPQDTVRVDFTASRPASKLEKIRIQIDATELHDARGKILKPYRTPGFDISWGGSSDEDSQINSGEQTIWLHLDPTFKTTNPLVFKGKVSIDEGWPIPFSLRLPKR